MRTSGGGGVRERRAEFLLKDPSTTVWKRGIAVAAVVPALAFLVGRLPIAGDSASVGIRALTFAVMAVLCLRVGQAKSPQAVWDLPLFQTVWCAGLLAATFTGSQRGWALTLLVASTEEFVFRQEAVRFVLRGSARCPRDLCLGLVAAECAFATSHIASGAVVGSATAWLALAGAGGCLGGLRFACGLPTTVALHFILNEASRSGVFGVFLSPGPLLLLIVAVGAPVLGGLCIPWLSKAQDRSGLRLLAASTRQ